MCVYIFLRHLYIKQSSSCFVCGGETWSLNVEISTITRALKFGVETGYYKDEQILNRLYPSGNYMYHLL
jgi:hypothetical protein